MDELQKRWMAMTLRMLTQVLIKVHAGKPWGWSEEEVLRACKESDEISTALLRPAQGDEEPK